jgi:hypothetical protein
MSSAVTTMYTSPGFGALHASDSTDCTACAEHGVMLMHASMVLSRMTLSGQEMVAPSSSRLSMPNSMGLAKSSTT